MKNKIFYLSTILTAFIFGCLVTYIAMSKQRMDAIMSVENTNSIQSSSLENNQETLPTNNNSSLENEIISQAQQQKLTINTYSEKEAKQLIDAMPDYVLSEYVNRFMAPDATDAIQDKRRFAERAIEELYTPNDTQPLIGTAKISFHFVMPEISENTSRVTKFAKIYAHLDTNGQVPVDKYVFIKWVNNQTGQVLLFEKKNISANSNQNWVSFVPSDGWQVGSYDVRFYQFNSELQPIAQTTYSIDEVVDESLITN